jgi:translation elongation factor EF-Ts
MMAVDIALVKRLKDLTGVGLTDAKAALEAANGDFDTSQKLKSVASAKHGPASLAPIITTTVSVCL